MDIPEIPQVDMPTEISQVDLPEVGETTPHPQIPDPQATEEPDVEDSHSHTIGFI